MLSMWGQVCITGGHFLATHLMCCVGAFLYWYSTWLNVLLHTSAVLEHFINSGGNSLCWSSYKSVKQLWRHPQDIMVLLLPTLEESKWWYSQGLLFLITFLLFKIEIKDDEKANLLQCGPNYDRSVLSSKTKHPSDCSFLLPAVRPEIAALIQWPFTLVENVHLFKEPRI